MRLELTLTSRRGRRRDLVVEAGPASPLGEVLGDYLDPGDVVHAGRSRVDLACPVGRSPVRSGADLTVGEPGADGGWPLDGPALAVLGGVDAGTLHPLATGSVVVGRGAPADVVLGDPTVSTRHAALDLRDDGTVEVADLGSSNGTVVAGRRLPVGEKARVQPGERFLLGESVVAVLAPVRPDGSVDVSPDGDAMFNRVVRYRAPEQTARIAVPRPPGDPVRTGIGLQIASSVAMLGVGVASALLLRNYVYALLGLVAPLVFIGGTLLAQRGTRREAARKRREYEAARARADERIAAAVAEEAERSWRATTDPATGALAALGPTSDLWSVDGHDEQAMLVRVGTHDRPARVTFQGTEDDVAVPVLTATPATVDLRAHPVSGIAGPLASARGAARALVHQLVTSRSPDELVVVHLSAEGTDDGWSWLRWVPHVRGLDVDVHAVSPGRDALNRRLEELTTLIGQRAELTSFGYGPQLLLPEVLVVLDGAGALRTLPSVVRVLREGPAVGIRVLAVDAVAARLPAEATARLVIDPQGSGSSVAVLESRGAAPLTGIVPDLVAVATAERSARAMAPLVPLGGSGAAALPDSVRFSDLYRLDGAGVPEVLARWSAGAECQAVLGVDESGRPVTVDLVHDGPHALVAGTSGSGKSELLRTLLTGLALSAPPQDLGLFLIDFKGGGAFGKLADLPHVVGYADDLTIGGHLADRLLDSLRAELDLRKGWFKAAGNAEDMRAYRAARALRPELPAVSRLVIVVDEFAELKEAQPDFVDGLVNVARVGRSLGVHLVLATQRPAGVVTAQIRDNANLRICLRVLDPGTSQDLVGSAVAAAFPNRVKGRAALVSGDGQPQVLQSAYVSGPVRTTSADEVPAPVVRQQGWTACGMPARPAHRAEEDTSATELSEVVRLLQTAAEQSGAPRARRPWRPPLGETVLLRQLVGGAGQVPWGTGLVGIEDRPAEQKQIGVGLRLGGGNLAVVGSRGSGRSTALRTLAAALASRHTADEVHLYVIDQTAASVLRPLAGLPHCGVVATRNERHRTERLVARLGQLADERAALLSARGASTVTELRRTDPSAPPHVVVLVDGWDQLVQNFSGPAEGLRVALVRLADEGPALGIQLVVAGGKAVNQSRLIGALEQVLVLRFDQRDDMAGFAVPVRELPAEIPPGRAHRPGTGNAVQIALLGEDGGTEAQNAALAEIAATAAPAVHHVPFRLDDLPGLITWADAGALPGGTAAGSREVLVGVGGDQLGGRVVDLDRLEGPFVVAGPAGKGRTAALVLLARQLTAKGVPVLVATSDPVRFPEVQVVDPRAAVELVEGAVVLVDDAGRVPDDSPLMSAALASPAVRLVVAGDPASLTGYLGWKAKLRTGTSGLLFSPHTGDGDLVGTTVRVDDAFTAGPGRAYLSVRGGREIVQVPWAG
ncbi:FtsK/SpoIIIE domain-containing protein [Geodermatophilus sp. SYSU D01180]